MLGKFKKVGDRFSYDDSEMPLLTHLDEFRKTLVRTVITLIVGMGVCAPFVPWITQLLRAPSQQYIDSGQIILQHPEVTSGFLMWVIIAFWSGVLVSMPALVFIIGSFILPGIKAEERKVFKRVSGYSGLLFVLGVILGYKITLPLAMQVMWNFTEKLGGEAIWNYQKYIGFTLQVLLGFGVAFQMPIIIILLGKMGLLDSTQLRNKRRHVAVGLFVVAMLLTPPDITTQVLLAAPLIALYEFCIWFLYIAEGKGKKPVDDPVEDDEATNNKE